MSRNDVEARAAVEAVFERYKKLAKEREGKGMRQVIPLAPKGAKHR